MHIKRKTSNIATINAIKHTLSIEDIALEYAIDIERSGNDWVALCPFHADFSTKSLHLYSATNSFYCFGCKKGGTIFDFVMFSENISFHESVARLSQMARLNKTDELLLPIAEPDFDQEKIFYIMMDKIEKSIFLELRKLYFCKKSACFRQTDRIFCTKIEQIWVWVDTELSGINNKIFRSRHFLKHQKSQNQHLFRALVEELKAFYMSFIKLKRAIELCKH